MLEAPSRPVGAAARVVVVDDSVSVCKAIARMLAPLGAEVVEIHSGEDALARLERERPDLVVCDLLLSDLEGLAICRFVRESRTLGGVPLVAISGLASDEVRRQALAAGADAVLRKPFAGDVLVTAVEALLARSRGGGRRLAVVPQLPPAVARVVAELESLTGLLAASWRLANGAAGSFRPTGSAAEPLDPEAALARLRSFAAPFGVGAPAMAVVEGEGGDLVLIGHRQRRGVVCLHLTESATLGKARYVARKFLRELEPILER